MLVTPHSAGFTFGVTNVSPTSSNTAFTAGGSNADGTAVSVLSALARDGHYLVVSGGGMDSGEDNNALGDVLIDPAGGTSWSSLIEDLCFGYSMTANQNNQGGDFGMIYRFPIWIPAGASLGWRVRKSGASGTDTGGVRMWVYGCPKNPAMWWCGQAVESLGINAASSRGTTVAPNVTSDLWGSWTTLGTSTRRYGALNFAVAGPDATSATTSRAYNFQIGSDSTQLPGSGTYRTLNNVNLGTGLVIQRYGFDLMYTDIAAGTTLQARAKCNASSSQSYTVAAYGVY